MVRLEIKDVHLSFGGIRALDGVSLYVEEGELVSLIGPNGAGKTSIINCVCKFYNVSGGDIYFEGKQITRLSPPKIASLGISRSFQNLELFKGMTVIDNVKLGAHIHMKSGTLSDLLYYGRTRSRERELEKYVEEKILDLLGLTKHKNEIVGSLPYGLQKRVDFARALAAEPKLLVLDEPAAGLNDEETKEMARHIVKIRESRDLSILLIEHDMNVVMSISDRVYVINFGEKIAEGTPDEVKINPNVIEIYLGKQI